MKKMSVIIGMCFLVLGLMAQNKKTFMLDDQQVVPPKFVGEVVNEPVVETSPICCFLQKNLPNDKRINGSLTEGTVAIEFTVNKDGSLTNFVVVNGVSFDLDQSVIDCIKDSEGMWQPGEVNGRPSAMEKRIYVRFDNPDNAPFEEIVRNHYYTAIKHFTKGQNFENNKLIEKNKQERKAHRMYKHSLAQLNDAMVYLPNDPSLAFWKAKNYEQLRMDEQMIEMLELRRELLSMRADEQKLKEYNNLAVISFK